MTRVYRHPIAQFAAKLTSLNPSGRRFYSGLAIREILEALIRLTNLDERYFAQESLVALAAEFGEIQGEWTAANTLIELVRRTRHIPCLPG